MLIQQLRQLLSSCITRDTQSKDEDCGLMKVKHELKFPVFSVIILMELVSHEVMKHSSSDNYELASINTDTNYVDEQQHF